MTDLVLDPRKLREVALTPVEYRELHATHARNLPLDRLDPVAVMQARNGSRDEPLYVICRSGNRSAYAAHALAGAGWDASNVADGMVGWHAAGLPMISESGEPYVA